MPWWQNGKVKPTPPPLTALQSLLDLTVAALTGAQEGFLGVSKHLTLYEVLCRVAGATSRHGCVSSSPQLPAALSAHEATSSEEPLGRGICSSSPRTGTLFCLSPYSHDPVSPRHFSTPGLFLFVSALAIPLPPLHHSHLIFTFRLGGTEEAFPCIAPTLFPAGIREQV